MKMIPLILESPAVNLGVSGGKELSSLSDPFEEPEKKEKPKELTTKDLAKKLTVPRPRAPRRAAKPNPAPPRPARMAKVDEPRPQEVRRNLGGEDPKRLEKPLPLGVQTGRRDIPPREFRMARAPELTRPQPRDLIPPDEPRPNAPPGKIDPAGRLRDETEDRQYTKRSFHGCIRPSGVNKSRVETSAECGIQSRAALRTPPAYSSTKPCT